MVPFDGPMLGDFGGGDGGSSDCRLLFRQLSHVPHGRVVQWDGDASVVLTAEPLRIVAVHALVLPMCLPDDLSFASSLDDFPIEVRSVERQGVFGTESLCGEDTQNEVVSSGLSHCIVSLSGGEGWLSYAAALVRCSLRLDSADILTRAYVPFEQ